MKYLARAGALAIVMTAGAALAAASGTAASAPSGQKAPAGVMQDLLDLFTAPAPSANLDPQEVRERIARNVERMRKVIKMGGLIEKEYPAAANLSQVRGLMLKAARMLAVQTGDTAPLEEIAAKILASDVPLEDKVPVDALLISFHALPPLPMAASRPASAPQFDAAKEIRDFVARYAGTKADWMATLEGYNLARRLRKNTLADELLQSLTAKYLDAPTVRASLRQVGLHPDVGRMFQADFVALDGEKISLPSGTAGKAVVLCFCSTTSPEYVELIPRLARLAEEHKDTLQVISVYAGGTKDSVTAFLKPLKAPWIHTLPGEPSAISRYEIVRLPAVWVLDRQGRVVSDSALYREEKDIDGQTMPVPDRRVLAEAVEKALEEPATAPAK